MKRAKIVRIFSPDVDDLKGYQPIDPENFCILLQICVGMSDNAVHQESGDTFDMEIFTPRWLLSTYDKEEVLLPKNSLIVFQYNFEKIHEKIRHLIESCYGDSWQDIAQQICKFAAWEFEDYQK